MDRKYWELSNIERSLSADASDSLFNIYRIIKIRDYLCGKPAKDPFHLIDIMKKIKMDIPFFSGDERLFYSLYERMVDLDNRELIEYAQEIISSNKYGYGPLIPSVLQELLFSNIDYNQRTVLICDAEKYGTELFDLVRNSNSKFYLTIKDDSIRPVFELLYKELNVEFINSNYYDYEFVKFKFDLILCFPIMGGRLLADKDTSDFISREPSFIAAQNLLYHLSRAGKLVIILPAKIGFGSGDAETLRSYIQENYKVNEIASLPTRIFYPYMSINTYLVSLSNGYTEEVCVKKYDIQNEKLKEEDSRLIFADELEGLNAWNVDMVFSVTDETILEYKNSTVKKARLSEVAEVFRGKAVVDKVDNGNVAVINISDISQAGIDYSKLDTINEEERKISRYLLKDGDVIVATKGANIKVGVFKEQYRPCIVSSNLCVIRPNPRLLNGTYLKLFLESDIGIKLLKTLQRGTTIVNINYQDICQLEVPTPTLDDQFEIANEYEAGLKLYTETIKAAEQAWNSIKFDVNKKLF